VTAIAVCPLRPISFWHNYQCFIIPLNECTPFPSLSPRLFKRLGIHREFTLSQPLLHAALFTWIFIKGGRNMPAVGGLSVSVSRPRVYVLRCVFFCFTFSGRRTHMLYRRTGGEWIGKRGNKTARMIADSKMEQQRRIRVSHYFPRGWVRHSRARCKILPTVCLFLSFVLFSERVTLSLSLPLSFAYFPSRSLSGSSDSRLLIPRWFCVSLSLSLSLSLSFSLARSNPQCILSCLPFSILQPSFPFCCRAQFKSPPDRWHSASGFRSARARTARSERIMFARAEE